MTSARVGRLALCDREAARAVAATVARATLREQVARVHAESWSTHVVLDPDTAAALADYSARLSADPAARVRAGIANAYATFRLHRPWRWLPTPLQARAFRIFGLIRTTRAYGDRH